MDEGALIHMKINCWKSERQDFVGRQKTLAHLSLD